MQWKKNETVFTVKVNKSTNQNGGESKMITFPLPLWKLLGESRKMRFEVMENGTVTVQGV